MAPLLQHLCFLEFHSKPANTVLAPNFPLWNCFICPLPNFHGSEEQAGQREGRGPLSWGDMPVLYSTGRLRIPLSASRDRSWDIRTFKITYSGCSINESIVFLQSEMYVSGINFLSPRSVQLDFREASYFMGPRDIIIPMLWVPSSLLSVFIIIMLRINTNYQAAQFVPRFCVLR